MNSKSSRDLPTDRLSTSDQQGRRIYLYPAAVTGRFRTYRTWVHTILILVFLAMPWLRINGHQALLLDIAQRRFAIFGITFWAHDAPMLVFIFGGGFLVLGLVTAIWGRVWCGWACPQTVFIDSLFRAIEKRIEGDHLARKALDAQEWSAEKLFKKSFKWFCFSFVTLIISHSFIAYFVGTDELALMIRHSPSQNVASFSIMLGITALILFDFGWFREQFCTVVCPYGRFQSLLMDDHSMLVSYDEKRGEPRKGTEPLNTAKGDCVNCYRCVQVCPTGIDIRRGAQLECIGCTACIDACDDVMTKTQKPQGLIRYTSEIELKGGKTKVIRGRTIAYTLLIAGVLTGLIITLVNRHPIDATFVRAADSPYQEIKNAAGTSEIVNRFKVDLSNQSFSDVELDLQPGAEYAAKGVEIIFSGRPARVRAGNKAVAEFFVKFPKALLSNGRALIKLNVTSASGIVYSEELSLVGPYL